MTISRKQRQQASNRGIHYVGLRGINRAPKNAPTSPQVPSSPTPGEANSEIASGSMQPASSKQDDIGVSGVKEKEVVEKVIKTVEQNEIDDMNSASMPAYAAPSEIGVGATTFQQISQTPRLLLKRFSAPARMFPNPPWNAMVGLVSKDGKFYNTQTTYAEWYAGFAVAAMFDDLVVYWGPIVRGAIPSIWPQGPLQAINEAKAAGVNMSNRTIIDPGKDLLVWMINGKIREWVKGYLNERYPNGIDLD